MKLTKYPHNPILTPNPAGYWEKAAVLNPGAWFENGTVYMLYRASGEFKDYRIYFGLATSKDGFNFERVFQEPVFGPSEGGFDGGCVEDARIVKLDDLYYVTYAARAVPPEMFWQGRGPKIPEGSPRSITENLSRTGLATTKDFRTFHRLGPITRDDVDDRDVIIFPEKIDGKYVMMHRPAEWVGEEYGTDQAAIWLAYSDDLLNWTDERLLAKPEFDWECGKVGGSCPPIKTPQGWLTIYHGVDATKTYRTGVMMLDLNDPSKIIARAPDFIMEPETECEKCGFVPNVVFPTSNVVIDDTLFVYYGGADQVCCVATVVLKDLVDYVLQYPWTK
ncbi:MAG: glycosidase [Chthoniobacteraceae bacterium]